MTSHCRALIGSVTAGALALGAAGPLAAQDRHRGHDRDGISTGEIIAGALIIGGLAAVLAASDDDDDYRDYDRSYRDFDHRDNRDHRDGDRYRARTSIEQCVRTAERRAERRTGGRAEVYEVREVDRRRGGYEVRGRIAVRAPHERGNWRDYRRGYGNDGWEEGRFTCDWRRGEVVDVTFRGFRYL